jgi:ParB family chromosome partitioning protein
MKVIDVSLNQIETGQRRRQDFGDIGALAEGMNRVGLLEPIIVDRNGNQSVYRLIAGERRLRAAQMLQWKTIPASLLEHLTEEELREIELEENENRKSLTEQERARTFAGSKRLVENAKKAKEILSHNETVLTGKRGQPAKPDSVRAVAASLGTDKENVRRAEQHVEEGIPWAGSTETCKGRSPVWRQVDFWSKRDFDFNYSAYKRRANSNAKIAENIARACRERFGVGPTYIEDTEDEPLN